MERKNYPVEKATRVIQNKKFKLVLLVSGEQVLYDVFQKEQEKLIRLGFCKVLVDEEKKPELQIVAEKYIEATGKDLKKKIPAITKLLRKELPNPN